MRTATAGGRRSPSPSSSPKKQQQKRPRWRRVDNVLTFPSSKRVHGLQHHSHHLAYSDPNNNPTTSQSDSGSPHYTGRVGHDNYQTPYAKAKEASSSSSTSVWVRLSDKPPTASPVNHCEDLEVPVASTAKCIPHHQQQRQQNYQVSHMEMDIDNVDGSGDEGCVVVDVSQRFIVADPPRPAKQNLVESDSHKLCQRQKQIDYGKNTLGYERYLELVPRKHRKKFVHPQTPDIKQVCSKRSWDGQVKKWRRRLHEFDPPASENEEAPQLFSNNGGSVADNQEENDTPTASGSEGNPKEEVVVLATYDDWDVDDDAMEP